MPTVLQNAIRWSQYPWEREGHEWSPGQSAAGGEMLWRRSLWPRIAPHLPTPHILEIGPGFGRWTAQLLPLCRELTAVDVTDRCVTHCRRRFGAHEGFRAFVNDGTSLEMVEDDSVDFAFSFDSLVHAESSVVRDYVYQLARKLKPGGTAFIHHSNLHALTRDAGAVPWWVRRRHWRGESMSARLFRLFCSEAGLRCRSQEIVNWIGRGRRADRHRVAAAGIPLTDTMSTFERRTHPAESVTRVYLNPSFADEWRQLSCLTELYTARGPSQDAHPCANAVVRAMRVFKSDGLPGALRRLRDHARERTEHAASFLIEHLTAAAARRADPIVNAVRGGKCPDCGSPLLGRRCEPCLAEFIV